MDGIYPELERRLKAAGISRRTIADALEISPAGLYKKTRGQAPFTLNEAFTIRDTFFRGVSLETLFCRGGQP